MRVHEEEAGPVVVLTPEGNIDLSTLPEFGARVDRLLERGVRYIIWDLSAVELLPSTALGYLLQSAQRLHSAGGRMVLAAARRTVLGTLQTMGVVGVFAIYDDCEEARVALTRLASAQDAAAQGVASEDSDSASG